MSNRTKIIIAVIVFLLLAAGAFLYWKKTRDSNPATLTPKAPSVDPNNLEALKVALASEQYKMYLLNTYSLRTPKPEDADAKLEAQRKIVSDLQAKVQALS